MFSQADAKHELIPWSDGKPWGGVTELRDINKLNETQLPERISELWDECNELGWQKFAQQHEVDGFQLLNQRHRRDITPLRQSR